jgi:hypothetical protein
MKRALRRGSRRSWRWARRAAYYVSLLLVLSFICCEVLDLDGSDFPVPSKSPRDKLAESTDLRRPAVVGALPCGAAVVENHTLLLKRDDQSQVSALLGVPVALRSRLTLPRAAPDDPTA